MHREAPPSAILDFIAQAAAAYNAVVMSPLANAETGLGGKLFYAGALDEEGRALVAAANVAGAATLTATADRAAQKQALRDGITDFLVTSLDEALRILKNQLRKREAVAVCVGAAPELVEHELQERGVQPDLLRHDASIEGYNEAFVMQDREDAGVELEKIPALVTWRVNAALPKDLAKLDEIAMECFDESAWQARRWLRLSPRYLGRLGQGLHLLASNREFAARFAERARNLANRQEISFAFEIVSCFRGLHDEYRFLPEPR